MALVWRTRPQIRVPLVVTSRTVEIVPGIQQCIVLGVWSIADDDVGVELWRGVRVWAGGVKKDHQRKGMGYLFASDIGETAAVRRCSIHAGLEHVYTIHCPRKEEIVQDGSGELCAEAGMRFMADCYIPWHRVQTSKKYHKERHRGRRTYCCKNI